MARNNLRTRRQRPALPSPAALVEFLQSHPEPLGTREIARAFGLGAAEQPALRAMLRRVERSGEADRRRGRFAGGTPLPELATVERFGSDGDGYPLVRLADAA